MPPMKFAAALIAMAVMASAAARPAGTEASEASLNIPVEELRFYQNRDGMIFADAWGDPQTGPHSNFIRIPPDTASPPHTHTSSYYGVVITGIVANERLGAAFDRPLRPGSYWFQKGSEKHVTKCLSAEACLIFVTSKGRFDYLPAP